MSMEEKNNEDKELIEDLEKEPDIETEDEKKISKTQEQKTDIDIEFEEIDVAEAQENFNEEIMEEKTDKIETEFQEESDQDETYNIIEETVPEEVVPEEMTPEEVIPEEFVPEETVPKKIIPEEVIPEELVHEEDIPEEAIPEEVIPEFESDTQEISEEERKLRLDMDFHKNQIEAALFVAGRPLGLEELSSKLEIKQDLIKDIIQKLAFEFLDRTTAIEIVQVGDKYSMQIKPEYSEKISKFAAGGLIPQRIMRTLTIIALKQPIMKSKLVKIRGSGAYEHVKWLLENEFVNAVKKGRTHELTTNQKFAETFGFSTNIEEMKKQIISQLEGEN